MQKCVLLLKTTIIANIQFGYIVVVMVTKN